MIIHEEATDRNSELDRKVVENIFEKSILQKVRIDELNNCKSYDMVGGKEVKNFQTKAYKKRANNKRTESAISVSKFSSTIRSEVPNCQRYLTKEFVISSKSPLDSEFSVKDI